MGIKPGPKRAAKSTGKPDRGQRDNKVTPENTPSLKPHIYKKGEKKLEAGTYLMNVVAGRLDIRQGIYIWSGKTETEDFQPI